MNQQDIIREIRQKNDIVDIISEKIPLVARGKNYFGVCPFHDDTNPSMSVSREKQIYTCFSCHATGNVFNFLMDYEHKEFKEVLKELADRVGIPLAGYHETKKTTKYDVWYSIYNLALKYYQNNLMKQHPSLFPHRMEWDSLLRFSLYFHRLSLLEPIHRFLFPIYQTSCFYPLYTLL